MLLIWCSWRNPLFSSKAYLWWFSQYTLIKVTKRFTPKKKKKSNQFLGWVHQVVSQYYPLWILSLICLNFYCFYSSISQSYLKTKSQAWLNQQVRFGKTSKMKAKASKFSDVIDQKGFTDEASQIIYQHLSKPVIVILQKESKQTLETRIVRLLI